MLDTWENIGVPKAEMIEGKEADDESQNLVDFNWVD